MSVDGLRPIVWWTCGKRQMLNAIRESMPADGYNNYYEPFFGGGAVWCDLYRCDGGKSYFVNDINQKLMYMYHVVYRKPDALVDLLRMMVDEYNSFESMDDRKAYYNKIKVEYNSRTLDDLEDSIIYGVNYDVKCAAMLIFLTLTSFSALYRTNRKGEFNVAFGNRTRVVGDYDGIFIMSNALEPVFLYSIDFDMFLTQCTSPSCGDFVFFDPPYYGTFTQYNGHTFSDDDNTRLYDTFVTMTDRGVKCMLTNISCDFINWLYRDYNIKEVPVSCSVRRKAGESVATNVIITNY